MTRKANQGLVKGIKIFVLILFIGLGRLTNGCQSPPPKQLTPAFYHWKTTYKPTATELALLRQLSVRKLYIHFFDVDWSTEIGAPAPKAEVQFATRPADVALVPVVYITNQTLMRCSPAAIPALARRIVEKVRQIGQKNGLTYAELQLDCDWTLSTRETYFRLLEKIRKDFNGPISATIRLHQIKFPDQTGVPPVDRVMLMFYNMADWKRSDVRNSIFDPAVANRYIGFLDDYPLPLDAVLPLFRWTVVYRNNRFLTLLNNLDAQTLKRQSFLSPGPKPNQFIACRDTTAPGFSVRRGDLFRAEACDPADLLTAKKQILSHIQTQPLTFALYHLDSTVLSPYPHAFFPSFFRSLP